MMDRKKLKRLISHKCKPITDRPDLSPAAVLIPLFKKNGETHILLTKRTNKVKHHKGQICFPGGAFHSEDLNLMSTALRETEEEIGLEIGAVEVLGELDHMATVSNFRVSPYVGIIPYPYPFKLNSFEVERLIELPLEYLLKESQLKEASFTYEGQSLVNLYLDYHGDIIWGATARILQNFMEVLS